MLLLMGQNGVFRGFLPIQRRSEFLLKQEALAVSNSRYLGRVNPVHVGNRFGKGV
jgi:hypothetical protein